MEWHKEQLPCGHDRSNFHFHPSLVGGVVHRCKECDKMKTYKYTAMTPIGLEKTGEIQANNQEDAAHEMRKRGLFVTHLKEANEISKEENATREVQSFQQGLIWGVFLGIMAGFFLGLFVGMIFGLVRDRTDERNSRSDCVSILADL